MRFWNKTGKALPAGRPAAPAASPPAASLKKTVEHLQEKALAARRRARAMLRRRRAVRRVLPAVFATAVYLAASFFMFGIAGKAAAGRAVLSLRYSVPLAPQQVDAAQFAMGDPEVEKEFSAAYWYQSPQETIETGRGPATTPVLYVDGDASTVIYLEFMDGGYPAALESKGLALSEGLAWQLLGSTHNTDGAVIKWHGEEYTVRGVFRGKEPLLLAQVDAKAAPIEGFTGMELAGSPQSDPQEAVKAYLKLAGLPDAPVILNTHTVPGILSLMAWLPFAVLAAWFALRLLRLARHLAAWQRQLIWFLALLAAAVLLPKALAQLPAWMIPTRWSDMEHWSAFLQQVNARITQWLGLAPSLADIWLKKQLILQAALLMPALLSLLAMIRYGSAAMRRADTAMRLRHGKLRQEG